MGMVLEEMKFYHRVQKPFDRAGPMHQYPGEPRLLPGIETRLNQV